MISLYLMFCHFFYNLTRQYVLLLKGVDLLVPVVVKLLPQQYGDSNGDSYDKYVLKMKRGIACYAVRKIERIVSLKIQTPFGGKSFAF